MIDPQPKAVPLYPKSHLLAASGIAALLSLALLVFPSQEVEAKKTDLTSQTGISKEDIKQHIAAPDLEPSPLDTPAMQENNPFADIAQPAQNRGEANSSPAPSPTSLDFAIKTAVVGDGDTLSTLFEKVGLSASQMHAALNSDKQTKQLGRLKKGQIFEFHIAPDGTLLSLTHKISDAESIALTKTPQGYSFSHDVIKPTVKTSYAHGVIKSSLSTAAQKAGIPHSMVTELAKVFNYDIDFAQDIRAGDEFEVIYENKQIKDRSIGAGNILSARFTNRGKVYTAVRYTNKQGSTNYYTASGNSMRKAFIRTPVDFARISSRFSMGRLHPILNKIRAHQGVDYAAPRGTPIKATGDGKVELAGTKGGYGNTIIIQHSNVYKTLYGHMQGFAKGIKNGSSVKQGQIIGYIGTTGLSTGPHLHYEFQVNGAHVDPLGQKLPMAEPIAKSEKSRFLQQSQPLLAQMDQEKATLLAMKR